MNVVLCRIDSFGHLPRTSVLKDNTSGIFKLQKVWISKHSFMWYIMDMIWLQQLFLSLSQRQISDSSKVKEFAEDNFKFDESWKQFFKPLENNVGKGENSCYKQFLLFQHSFQKRLLLQTCKNQGLFGKGLRLLLWYYWNNVKRGIQKRLVCVFCIILVLYRGYHTKNIFGVFTFSSFCMMILFSFWSSKILYSFFF